MPVRGFGLTGNYPEPAASYGVEAAGRWKVSDNLSFRANLSYMDARLSAVQTIPETVLPGAARWRLAEDLTYAWPSAPLQPRLTLSHRFESHAPSELGATVFQGDYHVFSGRLTLQTGDAEAAIFVDNIGNSAGSACTCQSQQFVEPPLRFGVSLDRYF